jgi:hypothetical protein
MQRPAKENQEMNADANDPSSNELDAFGRRLSASTREFNTGGEFSSAHGVFHERRRQSRAALEARLVASIRRGAVWQSIRLELQRDVDTLIDNFGASLDRMDVAAMKGRL